MCKIMNWDNNKSLVAADMLKVTFPACGIKYTGKYGVGLLLIRYDVADKNLIRQKAKASSDQGAIGFVIPKKIAAVYNI